jgi:hypothetical protein
MNLLLDSRENPFLVSKIEFQLEAATIRLSQSVASLMLANYTSFICARFLNGLTPALKENIVEFFKLIQYGYRIVFNFSQFS